MIDKDMLSAIIASLEMRLSALQGSNNPNAHIGRDNIARALELMHELKSGERVEIRYRA